MDNKISPISYENGKIVAHFDNALFSFLHHIESMRTTLPTLRFVITELGKNAQRELVEFEKDNCEVETFEEYRNVKIPFVNHRKWSLLVEETRNFRILRKIITESLFVSLVCHWDAFIGMLLKIMFHVKPEILNISEKNISFKDLTSFSSIDEARNYIVDKEIETILRQSHHEQLKTISKIFSIKLDSDADLKQRFVEITQRRNILVHSNGIISDQYITICKDNACNIDEAARNTRIRLGSSYFIESYECLYEMAVKLTHVLWRKFIQEDVEKADANLMNICYDLIDKKKYNLACRLLDFSCGKLIKHKDERYFLMLTINRAQSYKWNNKTDRAKEILDDVDWSAKSSDFKLAYYVLSDRWDNAQKTMYELGNSEELKVYYRDWPLYNEFRKRDEFLSAYRQIFKEEFMQETIAYKKIDNTKNVAENES